MGASSPLSGRKLWRRPPVRAARPRAAQPSRAAEPLLSPAAPVASRSCRQSGGRSRQSGNMPRFEPRDKGRTERVDQR
jgi:hypothetical protein